MALWLPNTDDRYTAAQVTEFRTLGLWDHGVLGDVVGAAMDSRDLTSCASSTAGQSHVSGAGRPVAAARGRSP